MVDITLDGRHVEVTEHTTVLQAAAQVGIQIPTLCYLEGINEIGACRVCMVEVAGIEQLMAACTTEVWDGMVIFTNSARARSARRTNVELILSQHDVQCTTCVRSGNCALQSVSNDLGLLEEPYAKHLGHKTWNQDFPLIRDADKCIRCLRCIQICDHVQATSVWDLTNRASRTDVGVEGGQSIEFTDCALCGQCITHCPTGTLRARDDTERVMEALEDPEKICVVQVAPSVRAAWGESLGLSHGQATAGKLVSALRQMGFDYVFDTDFSADLTIMEEGSEFVERLKNAEHETFPMFTSCCPGWVRFIKSHYPEYVDQLSSAKSPQQMFGAVTKSWFAERNEIDPDHIFSLSVMPCVAKKHECAIPCMDDAGAGPDVDVSITVREVDRLIKASHIDPARLEDEEFDSPLGVGSGAGVIFGATGGVMEAALRSAYFLVTGKNPDPDAFADVRGLDGWKEATFDLAGTPLHVAVASGLGNAKKLLDALKAGEVSYDFVEIMACPGGCAGGGGQPIHDGKEMAGERGQVLYGLDEISDIRFSHENPSVLACYDEYLTAPLSEKAHKLLHTDHHAWSMPNE